MLELFPENETPWTLKLRDAELRYYPNFWTEEEATMLFQTLLQEIPWRQDPITIFGKTYPQPRLTSLHSIDRQPYSYSGIQMNPEPMSKTLAGLLDKIKTVEEHDFTSVLLNQYRNGMDSNGWHSDDEKELGKRPIIASVSFGEERYFHLKHKTHKEERLKIKLGHGSLLIMGAGMQEHWQHQIAKTKRAIGARINLTFRKIRA